MCNFLLVFGSWECMLVNTNPSSIQSTFLSGYPYLNHCDQITEKKLNCFKAFCKEEGAVFSSKLPAYKPAVHLLWLPSAVVILDTCLTRENFAERKGKCCLHNLFMWCYRILNKNKKDNLQTMFPLTSTTVSIL